MDALFQSAAEVCGERVAAVVLSGAMWDGARGMAAVAKAGGITIAQDEATSDHFDMPAAALDLGGVDLVMSPQKIAETLRFLGDGAVRTRPEPPPYSAAALAAPDPTPGLAAPQG